MARSFHCYGRYCKTASNVGAKIFSTFPKYEMSQSQTCRVTPKMCFQTQAAGGQQCATRPGFVTLNLMNMTDLEGKKVIFPDNEALSRFQAWLHLFWGTHCPCSLQKRAATLILKVINDETLSILDLTAGANITIFLEGKHIPNHSFLSFKRSEK